MLDLIHETTLFAEPIAKLWGLPITNALLNSWLVVLVVIGLSLALRRGLQTVPRGLQNATEAVIESGLTVFDGVTNDRAKSWRLAPIDFSFFFFILLNNWLGLLPGVGSVGYVITRGSENIFVPYLRGGTADLNTTLALAIIGVVASHILGVLSVGAWRHLNKFINLRTLAEIPKQIRRQPSGF